MSLRIGTWAQFAVGVMSALGVGLVVAPGCIFAATQTSLGTGSGSAGGTLSDPDCWSGLFNLDPDFFAGIPYRDSFDIRIQKGSDFETFSDGISILVDDVHTIRPDSGPGQYGQALPVSLPPGVTPPGVPIQANPSPANVHMTLYLGRSCHTQNVALYAMDCDPTSLNGSGDAGSTQPVQQCGATPAPVADAATEDGSSDSGASPTSDGGSTPSDGHSTMTFTSLFDGNPDESDAAQRLTSATFDVYLADPRDICPGGLGPPPPCKGHISGSFEFYFQRGRPAQPFP